MNGLATHQPQARRQRKGVTGNRLGKTKGRRNGNLKCRGDRIDAVSLVSPPERNLMANVLERAGDLLRARPWTTHLRAGKHGDDENLHGLRLRARRKSTQLLLIVFAPHAHGLEDGLQAAAQLSERVLDARRHLGENLTVNNARILHGA